MKNVMLLFATAFLMMACGEGGDVTIKSTGDGGAVLRFHASKKYLLLPIEDKGEEVTMTVFAGDERINRYVIRLAKDRTDYWMPLELAAWEGREMEVIISPVDLSAPSLKAIALSDTFAFDYAEKYRPAYHFSPPTGWMNDPNGMVYYAGEYHLFYQYNPFGTRWQNMSWGHAVSRDLLQWEHLPVALWPDSLGTIFSGSAVVDEKNTTGFQSGGEKTLLAFYTQSERGGQWQSLAYSNDKGRTWTKYDGNPVLRHDTAHDFRDPKVFWYEPTGRWIMVLAVGQVIEIYSSPNAKEWMYESCFGEDYGAHGGTWECPDLFELPIENTGQSKWVMIVNINPGGPFGGSATQYFTGTFDGKAFECENPPDEKRWMDYGKDHYAAVTWATPLPPPSPQESARRIAIAWMSNWEYANDLPTLHFRSSLSIPRELKLIRQGDVCLLTNYPVQETEALRGGKMEYVDIEVKDEYSIGNLLEPNAGTYELRLEITPGSAEIIGFTLSNNEKEYITVSINLPEKCLSFDRTNSGEASFSDHFPSVTYAPLQKKKSYQIRLLVDKASVECFAENGEVSMTHLIFPHDPYNRISFYAKGGNYRVNKLEVYPLSS